MVGGFFHQQENCPEIHIPFKDLKKYKKQERAPILLFIIKNADYEIMAHCKAPNVVNTE